MKDYLFGILFLILLIGIFTNGLFFDYDFYLFETVILVIFIVYMSNLLLRKKEIPILPIIVFIIPLLCLLYIFIPNNNLLGTYQELLRFSSYAAFFSLLYLISRDKKINAAMENSVVWLGLIISIMSLFVYCGWIPFESWLTSTRLGGPFEYPNSYGAIMGAFFIYSLFCLVNKSNPKENILLSISTFSFMVNLLLSNSTGAIGITIIVFLLSLFFIRGEKQYFTILLFFLNSGLALCIYLLRDYTLVMFIIFFVLAFLSIYIIKKIKSLNLIKFGNISSWIIPTILILVSTSLFWFFKLHKQPTAIERIQMSKDAFNIFLNHPLGLGGNSWEMVYSSYQSYPYISSELHNGYLDFIVNWGVLGIIAVSLLIFVFVKVCLKNNKYLSTPSILFCSVILLHSALDFTLAYGSVCFLLCWHLSLAIKPESKTLTTNNRMTFIPIILLSLFATIISSKFAYAEFLNSQWSSDLKVESALVLLEKGRNANPYDPEIQRRTGALYTRLYVLTQQKELKEKALYYLQKSESLQPNNSELKLRLLDNYKSLQEKEELIYLAIRGIKSDPFQKVFYEEALSTIEEIEGKDITKIKNEITQLLEHNTQRWKNTNLTENYNAKNF